MISIDEFEGFEWDVGNEQKNKDKHDVSKDEAEQAFFNQPIIIVDDVIHSVNEARFHLYGTNDDGDLRHITFTIRNNKIRVISARPMHRKEKKFYEENT